MVCELFFYREALLTQSLQRLICCCCCSFFIPWRSGHYLMHCWQTFPRQLWKSQYRLDQQWEFSLDRFFGTFFWSNIKNMAIFGISGSGQIQNTPNFLIYVNFWPSYGHLKKIWFCNFGPWKSRIFNIFFWKKINNFSKSTGGRIKNSTCFEN